MDEMTLVSGLKAGNEASQVSFWLRYYDEVYPICARILSNPADATDVTVDLLVDFMNYYVVQLDEPRALHAYLRMMAIRRSVIQRERRTRSLSLAFDPEDLNGAAPDEVAHWHSLAPRLDECLGRLSPKSRQILSMKFRQYRDHVSIGRNLGVSKQYIGRVVQQSLKALRRCIEGPAGTGEVMR